MSFASVLDKTSKEIERPKTMPVGSYIGVVQGLPTIDKSKIKQTEYSEYTIKYMSAMDDVDEDDLTKALTKSTGEKTNLSEKSVKTKYYHTDDSLFMLKQFFEHLDIPEEDDDGNELSMRQRMQLVPNRQIGFHIKHAASEDGERVFANIDKTFKVE